MNNTDQCYGADISPGIIWPLFSLIMLFGPLLNGIFILVILTNRRLRTSTNFLLTSLAFADGIQPLIIPTNVIYSLNLAKLSHFECVFSQFTTPFVISLSVFTFIAVFFEIFFATVYPLKRWRNSRTAIGAIIVIWVFSLLINLPIIFITEINQEGYCDITFTKANTPQELYHWKIFNLSHLMIFAVIPTFVCGIFFIRIACRLWRKDSSLSDCRNYQVNPLIEKRKQVVKMLMVAFILFVCCFTPQQILFILEDYELLPYQQKCKRVLSILVLFLLHLHVVTGPISYFTINKRFQRGFLTLIPCLECCFSGVKKEAVDRRSVIQHTDKFQRNTVLLSE